MSDGGAGVGDAVREGLESSRYYANCDSDDTLFHAAVYALLIVAPLAHVDGAVLNRLFGTGGRAQMRVFGEKRRQLFETWW